MKHQVISVLCNPVRLKLIQCLAKKSKTVNEMVQTCGLSQSAISQHLLKLKEAGLVKDKKEGLYVYYSLIHPKSAEVAQLITNFCEEVKK